MVNFWDAISQLIAKAIVFFTELFHQNSFLVLDKLIQSVFVALGYNVSHGSTIHGVDVPVESERPGFFASEMSRGIRESWKNVSTVAVEGVSDLIETGLKTVDAVQEQFITFLTPYTDDFVDALLPGTPKDERVVEFSKKISEGFMQALDKIKPKAKSKVSFEAATIAASTYLGGNIALNFVSRIAGAAGDAVHPIKGLGIKEIIDGIWWGLGLNWLTWVALGPYMQSYIAKPLARGFRQEFSESDLTRSDVLKAYRKGIMTIQEANLKLDYLGYDENDRTILLQLQYENMSDDDKSLSRSTILSALKLGYVTEDDTIQSLTDMGYSDDDIELLIKITLHEKDSKDRDLTRAQILRLYKDDIITLEATQQHLSDMGYNTEEIALMIELEDLKSYPTRKYLTKAEVGNYYKKGLMSQQEASNYWYFLGYGDYEIGLYFQEYS